MASTRRLLVLALALATQVSLATAFVCVSCPVGYYHVGCNYLLGFEGASTRSTRCPAERMGTASSPSLKLGCLPSCARTPPKLLLTRARSHRHLHAVH